MYVAFLGGHVGYFATVGEIPIGWKYCAQTRDITDVMRSMGLSKAEALKVMNR
ncbi:MAG: hypothetical protein HY226_05110 [Candidatus Vogelbacteria bacterium]|nr:hypothetical protein [Candidatus Vogelbacteria bacterium]